MPLTPIQPGLTREDMNRYLATLSPDCVRMYVMADLLVKCTDDTLTEDFQLAASVREVFYARLSDWPGLRSD